MRLLAAELSPSSARFGLSSDATLSVFAFAGIYFLYYNTVKSRCQQLFFLFLSANGKKIYISFILVLQKSIFSAIINEARYKIRPYRSGN